MGVGTYQRRQRHLNKCTRVARRKTKSALTISKSSGKFRSSLNRQSLLMAKSARYGDAARGDSLNTLCPTCTPLQPYFSLGHGLSYGCCSMTGEAVERSAARTGNQCQCYPTTGYIKHVATAADTRKQLRAPVGRFSDVFTVPEVSNNARSAVQSQLLFQITSPAPLHSYRKLIRGESYMPATRKVRDRCRLPSSTGVRRRSPLEL